MGGRFGDGAVQPEDQDAPVFAEDWHGRALAITLACGALGQWNIDVSRHAREKLAPKDYARFSYYDKWMAGLADLLVESGMLTVEDLAGTGDADRHPFADRALAPQAVAAALAAGGPADRSGGPSPIFSVGDLVRTRARAGNARVPGGHTCLPAYAQGARGRIVLAHGTHVLPNMSAHRLGDGPEPLYGVAFPASELWSMPENPKDDVILDLWQSYLEPA